jgi:hypothetical protein
MSPSATTFDLAVKRSDSTTGGWTICELILRCNIHQLSDSKGFSDNVTTAAMAAGSDLTVCSDTAQTQ